MVGVAQLQELMEATEATTRALLVFKSTTGRAQPVKSLQLAGPGPSAAHSPRYTIAEGTAGTKLGLIGHFRDSVLAVTRAGLNLEQQRQDLTVWQPPRSSSGLSDDTGDT